MFNWILKIDLFLFARFVAAVFVIRQHANFESFTVGVFDYTINIFGSNNAGGSAVAFFFIISGYLMAKVLNLKYLITLEDSSKKIIIFLINRVARIFPLYYFTILISSWFLFPNTLTFFNEDGSRKLYLLLTMQYRGDFAYNQVIWSIGPEMFFYIISPFLALLVFKFFKKNVYINLVLFIFSLIFLSRNYMLEFYFSIIKYIRIENWMGENLPGVDLFLNHLPKFMVGYFGFYIIKYLLEKLNDFQITKAINIFRLCSFFVILFFLMTVDWFKISESINFVIFAILTMVLIFLIELTDFYTFKKPSNIINHLGDLSYGVYLIHMLILIRFNDLYRDYLHSIYSYKRSGIIVLVYVTIFSIITAHFLYYTIELPGGKFIKKLIKK